MCDIKWQICATDERHKIDQNLKKAVINFEQRFDGTLYFYGFCTIEVSQY